MDSGVKLGLGTDIAGGYEVDIMGSMRMAVIVSRMREGARLEESTHNNSPLEIDWKEALYLATRGGTIALGLDVGSHPFQEGLPFDAQQSEWTLVQLGWRSFPVLTSVQLNSRPV
jgi:guanine deaminase